MRYRPVEWYRSSDDAPGRVRPSVSRAIRNWLRGRLPEPDVRDKTLVIYARRGFPKLSSWAGMFSEFHSVLGALAYAEMRGAAGVRVDFRSALYVDPERGPNWWTHFFTRAEMAVRPSPSLAARGESLAAFDGRCVPAPPHRAGKRAAGTPAAGCVAPPSNTPGILGRRALPSGRLARLGATPDFHHGLPGELHLNRVVAKYGRHGGFCDLVNGVTPYLYPMTWGVSRSELHRLVTTHIDVRPEIRDEVDRIVAASFEPGAYIVGVHYRGTDSTHGLAGSLVDHRTYRIPYSAYADEVRRVLAVAAPRRCQVLVATDETEFLDFMRRELGDRVLCLEDAPRVRAGGAAIHFDDALQVSNYQKGKSGLVDCLLLAATSYLVKGRSNLSDASLAFNPRLPYSFCVR
jgi:hypothetical protein